jgi:hypothetical protein
LNGLVPGGVPPAPNPSPHQPPTPHPIRRQTLASAPGSLLVPPGEAANKRGDYLAKFRCDDNLIQNYWFSLFKDRLYISETDREP